MRILSYSPAMVTLRWIILSGCVAALLASAGCGDGSANAGGSAASPGTGGMGATPDAGVSCIDVESGCDDGNACTVDGLCERVTGECIGAGPEPEDTPCGQNDIFVCDGQGSCVGCNVDAQCEAFFPDDECRAAPQCIDTGCPLPDPLPEGTPCSSGECRSGVCSSPWAPKQQLVPMACAGSISAGLFDSSMELTVDPTMINPAMQFSASVDSSLEIPAELLQQAVIESYPTPLLNVEVTRARAEIVSTRVASGSPVSTTLAPLPQTVPIPQVPNTGDAGGQSCATSDDCPLGRFGQVCGFFGGGTQCACACQDGCVPQNCANIVEEPVVLRLESIQGAIYSAFPTGDVCFDVGGDAYNPVVGLPVRTGVRVTTGPVPFAIDCDGGTVNDNGTPGVPEDDFVVPNAPAAQICFPIGAPQ